MEKSKIKNQKSKIKFKIQNFSRYLSNSVRDPAKAGKFYITILIFTFCILNFVGCATLVEGTRRVIGISTKVLEDNRPSALKQAFNYDYNTCYAKAKDALTVMQCYIYAEETNKNLIAIYVSKEDTTPVGIFFKAIDNSNTQIEVSSASTYAKESIAQRILAIMSGLPDPIPPITEEE